MVKNSPANVGDTGSISGSIRSPREGTGNPLQYSCLGNAMVRGAWQATVHGVTKSWTQLSNSTTKRQRQLAELESLCPPSSPKGKNVTGLEGK